MKAGFTFAVNCEPVPVATRLFILLVTAKGDTTDLEQALQAGANDYLTKPLDLGLLNVRLSVAERQIRDLAERNHARAALQESARTLHNILENTTDGFFALDRNWRFTYLNPEAERLLERRRDELINKELWKEFPEILDSPFELNYRRVMEEQEAVEFEASDVAGKIWFEVNAYPNGGRRLGLFSRHHRTQTPRRRATDDRQARISRNAGRRNRARSK